MAWCAIFISWAAEEAGVRSKTGTEAWTVGWANWYAAKGKWGTKPKVGALVFYDWSGGKSRSGIDHVGIVEKVNANGSIVAIEGNHSNAVARVPRSSSIVGYGYWA
ncbi:CHAP domain-containing protein [Nonomuraea candida]|uniref:CHAP domain-containing protein n=1 Tax=Nonomuraea candida TaxID=359159 RepID=UPI000694F559|nr:CHAP domain-containing protein [Nonomuraea candida]